MATGQFIPPFPDDIDRDAFGHWLSGFTDGEGYFILWRDRSVRPNATPKACFGLNIRLDDIDILKIIQSFIGLGTIVLINKNTGNRKHQCRYSVYRPKDLVARVIPQFVRYPLRAKKRRDFEIWRMGVELCHRVNGKRVCGDAMGRGCSLKWTDEELKEFQRLMDELVRIRKYNSENRLPVPVQPIKPLYRVGSLFE